MRTRLTTLFPLVAIAFASVLVSAVPARATYSGANGKIAFSTPNSGNPDDPQIFTVNPDGSVETQLTFPTSGHSDAPDFSPDGKRIAFQGDATGQWQIYVMNADGTSRQQLTSDSGDHLNPKFSADGSKIAFAGCPLQQTCAVYVMDADGRHVTGPLTFLKWSVSRAEFSPDGSKIAFDSNQDGLVSAIWLMNADGTNQRRLTPANLEANSPDWSPDGRHIVFTDNCCLPHSNIWTMNADGTAIKKLTNAPPKHSEGFGTYSPDGKKIVFVGDLRYPAGSGINDVYTMDVNGNHQARIVTDQPTVLLLDWGASQ